MWIESIRIRPLKWPNTRVKFRLEFCSNNSDENLKTTDIPTEIGQECDIKIEMMCSQFRIRASESPLSDVSFLMFVCGVQFVPRSDANGFYFQFLFQK